MIRPIIRTIFEYSTVLVVSLVVILWSMELSGYALRIFLAWGILFLGFQWYDFKVPLKPNDPLQKEMDALLKEEVESEQPTGDRKKV